MDRIRNEIITGTTKAGEASKKVQERRLKWYRRHNNMGRICGERVSMRMDVERRRRKGRPKRGWVDTINVYLRMKGLSGEVM